MTILEKVRTYYQANSSDLNSFLEETSFCDASDKYPNSVVIKFGIDKVFGEVSIWQYPNESYMEFEYVDPTTRDREPVIMYKKIDVDSVIDELSKQFAALREL